MFSEQLNEERVGQKKKFKESESDEDKMNGSVVWAVLEGWRKEDDVFIVGFVGCCC